MSGVTGFEKLRNLLGDSASESQGNPSSFGNLERGASTQCFIPNLRRALRCDIFDSYEADPHMHQPTPCLLSILPLQSSSSYSALSRAL